jgi:acetyl esterase/lipase
MDRRAFIGALALTALPGTVRSAAPSVPAFDSIMTLPLWPAAPPGGPGVDMALRADERGSDLRHDRLLSAISRPLLCVFPAAVSDGSALLIMPGGGYRELQIDNEGFDVARRFNEAGVTAFVLLYRLPHEGWSDFSDVPLQDAQRAMRLIRANAVHFGIDPARVGVLGFSAGGHLAASLATHADVSAYALVDAAERMSAKPSFAALLYPVITMLRPFAHEASRDMLLGPRPSFAKRAAYSCERLVTGDTPATFLIAAADDPDVSPENTLKMFDALRRAHAPAEMHLFERGGHGFGIRGAVGWPAAAWPDLLLRWGASRRYFSHAGAPG